MVKIGFIGCGGIAGAHLSYLSKIEDVKIVGLCDIVEEKARAYSQKYGGNVYTDYRVMFEKEKMDACYISLIPSAHIDQEIIAARKKINIFVDKPIALSMKKAKEINSVVKKEGIIACVGYQIRYVDALVQLKDFLKDKKVAMVRGYYLSSWVNTPWWKRMKDSGGQVVEQATHAYDLARYLLGEVDMVYSLAYRGLLNDIPENDIDDASSANLKFKNGAIGNFSTTCLLQAGGGAGLDIILKHTMIKVDFSGYTIITDQPKEVKGTNDCFMDMEKTFIEAVKTGNPSKILSNYEDGMKTLELTLAVNESIRTGKPVRIK